MKIWWFCLLLAGLAACSGCSPLQPAAPTQLPGKTATQRWLATATHMPSPRPTETAQPARTEVPTATLLPSATAGYAPDPATKPANSTQGWQRYTQPTYGFTFLYPPGWTMKEDLNQLSTSYRHLLRLSPAGKDTVVLSIGFKKSGENYGIQRTGVGSGDFYPRGSVSFFGEPLQRQVLVANGLDMTVLYGAGEIRRGELIFTLGLDFIGPPTGPAGLTVEQEQQADWVVESFAVGKQDLHPLAPSP